ncbi:MAG: nuclear transport factor 2 family protein [Betaproteobacteria bacterium]|nr:MAG: nuclear transport factor 2 family protein [Betaproteobacteria bacterium]
MRAAHIDRLISFYETMSPETVANLTDVYTADAYFKDPFNEFNGVDKIEEIFRHMYRRMQDPRFVIQGWLGTDHDGFVVWDMHFRSRFMRGDGEQTIHGVSHIRFDASGKVSYHRDYWDTGEELYAKLPLLGWLIRRLRRAMA